MSTKKAKPARGPRGPKGAKGEPGPPGTTGPAWGDHMVPRIKALERNMTTLLGHFERLIREKQQLTDLLNSSRTAQVNPGPAIPPAIPPAGAETR